jgi:hypothetical protein
LGPPPPTLVRAPLWAGVVGGARPGRGGTRAWTTLPRPTQPLTTPHSTSAGQPSLCTEATPRARGQLEKTPPRASRRETPPQTKYISGWVSRASALSSSVVAHRGQAHPPQPRPWPPAVKLSSQRARPQQAGPPICSGAARKASTATTLHPRRGGRRAFAGFNRVSTTLRPSARQPTSIMSMPCQRRGLPGQGPPSRFAWTGAWTRARSPSRR